MGFLVVFGFFFCSRQDSPTKVGLGESPLDHWRGGGTKGIGKGTHFDQKKGKGTHKSHFHAFTSESSDLYLMIPIC